MPPSASTDTWTLLSTLCALPTAPLLEQAPATFILRWLQQLGLPTRTDRYGNIICSIDGTSDTTPIAFVVHLDHPAFAVISQGDKTITTVIRGGLAPTIILPATSVRLYDREYHYTPAYILQEIAQGTQRLVTLQPQATNDNHKWLFATLDLPEPYIYQGHAFLPAADDLAQASALLLLAERLVKHQPKHSTTFLFTRAEEIGLVGAYLTARTRTLPLTTCVVSLECSRALPGAELGKGPVIRVGDAGQSFSPASEALLMQARDLLQKQHPNAMVQRQLMSGGFCEASAFLSQGYTAGGLALPLEGYHNCGPEGTLTSERIALSDLECEIDLCEQLVHSRDDAPSARFSRLATRASEFEDALVQSAATFSLDSSHEQSTP